MASPPCVQNVVATASVGQTLYLPAVARALQYGEYNHRRFQAITFRIARPRSTALIFATGRVVCTGTKSRDEALLAMYTYVDLLRTRAGIKGAHVYGFEIQNVVASAALGHPVDLAAMARAHPRSCSYEPSLFPGLVFRGDDNGRVVLLFFRSGRMVVTGGKTREDLVDAHARSLPLLQAYARGHSQHAAEADAPDAPRAPQHQPRPPVAAEDADESAAVDRIIDELRSRGVVRIGRKSIGTISKLFCVEDGDDGAKRPGGPCDAPSG